MFAAASIAEMVKFYEDQGGVYPGLWSVLLSNSAEQSADFARRHFESFNNVAGNGWHLAVFAESKLADHRRIWIANESLHNIAIEIRDNLNKRDVTVPDLCAVFFDPNAGSFNESSLIIPFDANRIASESWYKMGFEETHRCIMRAFEKLKLDPYCRIPVNKVDEVIQMTGDEISRHGIRSHVHKIGSVIGNAGLGAIFGNIPMLFH